MIRSSNSSLHQRKKQQGWITLEVILSLVLLSVVLHFAQQQSNTQWQSIQLAETSRKLEDNEEKQALMAELTESSAWLNIQSNQIYPDCQQCKGSDLEQWFSASLYSVSQSEEGE